MYCRLRSALNAGGVLVTRDTIREADPEVTAWHHRQWRDFMQGHGEDGDFWLDKHRQKERPEPLEHLMRWEQEAGFNL